MPLYVGEKEPSKPDKSGKPSIRNVCHFYTSTDLKHWTFASKFSEELFECPGLVELPLDGRSKETRWVLWGGNGDYWVGKFDGTAFTAVTPKLKGDFGANYYAAQAYDDLPDKRVVLVTWMNGGKYPGMPFNQQMGFPVELSLQTTPEGIRMVKWPVKELAKLFTSALHEDLPHPTPPGRHIISGTSGDLLDLEIEFIPGDAASIVLELKGQKIVWNAKTSELTAFGKVMPLHSAKKNIGRRSDYPKPWGPDFEPWDGSVRLRILLDRTSIELYGDGGVSAASFCFLPNPEPSAVALSVEGGALPKARIVARGLKSAWK
jgi:levanase/fructan beta-fructosidase